MSIAIALTPLVRTVVSNLNNMVVCHVMCAWDMKKVLEELQLSVEIIDGVLEDAEEQQSKSKAVTTWLKNLSDVAYEANDLFIKIKTIGLEQDMKKKPMTKFKKFVTRFTMGKKLKRLRDRLKAIADQKQLIPNTVMPNRETSHRLTSSSLNESNIYGRTHEKNKLVHDLVRGLCSESQLSVYSVCGMGGIGKTALAKLVYNDPNVINRFQRRIWVCVSDVFDMLQLVSAILECTGAGANSGATQREPLEASLREKLDGKRFLLVLDDVWNEDSGKWDELMSLMSCGGRGSTIMVTMRDEKVAGAIGVPTPKFAFQKALHKVLGLSDDDSWDMFKQHAFENAELVGRESELVNIAKEMTKKCCGVPLAIKTLGSLMRHKAGISEWKYMLDNSTWADETNSGIMSILKLSYFHLPRHLRPCFAYCSIFPKDYNYNKDELIRLWVANDFVTSLAGRDALDVANDYFWELVHRSIFQDVKEMRSDVTYNINDSAFAWYDNTCFKIHDLMHDLALSVMTDSYSTTGSGKKRKIPAKVRHLYLDIPEIYSFETTKKGSLRSFLMSDKFFDFSAQSLSSYLLKEENLRAFVMYDSKRVCRNMSELLTIVLPSIGKLKQLRYLDLTCSGIDTLPKSVGVLLNLQVLILFGCGKLRELPSNMKQLQSLVLLDVRDCDSLSQLPSGIEDLKQLQILSDKYIAKVDGQGIFGFGNYRPIIKIGREIGLLEIYSRDSKKEAENLMMDKLLNCFYRNVNVKLLKWY